MSALSTVVVASKDDLLSGWERAQTLLVELKKTGLTVRLINKLGFDLEELTLVAKHRVLSTPTILVLRDGKVVYRRLGVPPSSEVLEAIRALK